MVPTSYHDFFLGAVTIGGALTGLLFVAISVHPSGLAGTATTLTQRVQATSALSALVDSLFLSLLALLPGGSIGGAALAFGISGTVTMGTLLSLVIVKRKSFGAWRLFRMIALIVGQGSVYVIQVVNAVNLHSNSAGTNDINTQTILIVVFFGFGIARAWEYVGGQRTGIWGTIDQARRSVLSHLESTANESAADEAVPAHRPDDAVRTDESGRTDKGNRTDEG